MRGSEKKKSPDQGDSIFAANNLFPPPVSFSVWELAAFFYFLPLPTLRLCGLDQAHPQLLERACSL